MRAMAALPELAFEYIRTLSQEDPGLDFDVAAVL